LGVISLLRHKYKIEIFFCINSHLIKCKQIPNLLL
jgi:hypothetical protein